MAPLALNSLLAEVSACGWYVYAINQEPFHPMPWSVSLRHLDCLIAYGQGQTIIEALDNAIDQMANSKPHTEPAVNYTIEPTTSLRQRLGLGLPIIDRRI